jgi:hypothetical protein
MISPTKYLGDEVTVMGENQASFLKIRFLIFG